MARRAVSSTLFILASVLGFLGSAGATHAKQPRRHPRSCSMKQIRISEARSTFTVTHHDGVKNPRIALCFRAAP